MGSTDFFIPDTSPLLSYTPCWGCSSSVGWVSAYAPRADGYDQTFHQTQGPDAAVSLNISASSLSFTAGIPSGAACNAVYTINGSSPRSACGTSSSQFAISNLPAGIHQVVFRPQFTTTGSSSAFEFIGITGQLADDVSGKTLQNITMDTTSSTSFIFSPSSAWTQIDSTGSVAGSANNETLVAEFSDTSGFFDNTLSATTAQGATASLNFKASAIYVFGLSGPEGGTAEITVDGVLTNTLNLTNPWKAYSSLLYMNSGLDPSISHDLSIINTSPGLLVLDYVVLTTPQTSTPSSNLPVIIGSAVGGTVFLLIFGILTFIFIRRSRRRTSPSSPGQAYGFAKGISSDDSKHPKAWSIDTWRKQASTSSQASTPIKLSSTDYPRINTYEQSPPPDYIPYTGPITTRPPETDSSHHLETRSNTGTSSPTGTYSSHDQSSSESTRSLRRPSPLHLRDRDRNDRFENIALDDYNRSAYDGVSIMSPATPSSIGVVGTTARAVNGRRSVARLWPTSRVIPSSYRASSVDDRNLNAHLPTFSVAGDANIPSQLTLGRSPSNSATGSRNLSGFPIAPSPTPTQNQGVTLRRGVSIKSVKTMRSFFSALLFSSSPIPSTPALPTASARPDSGIFPTSLSRQNTIPPIARQYQHGSYNKSIDGDSRTPESSNLMSSIHTSENSLRPIETSRSRSRGDDSSPDFFIELNPNSPITASRPGSYMTNHASYYYRGGTGQD